MKGVLPEVKCVHIVGKSDISLQSAAKNEIAQAQHRKSLQKTT